MVSLSEIQKSSNLTDSPAKNLPRNSFEMHSVYILFASFNCYLSVDDFNSFFYLKSIVIFINITIFIISTNY